MSHPFCLMEEEGEWKGGRKREGDSEKEKHIAGGEMQGGPKTNRGKDR